MMNFREFADAVVDRMLVEKEEDDRRIGEVVELTFDIPVNFELDDKIDEIREEIEDLFYDALGDSCLEWYDACVGDCEVAKEDFWFDELEVKKEADKIIVKFVIAAKCFIEVEIEGCHETIDITLEEFQRICDEWEDDGYDDEWDDDDDYDDEWDDEWDDDDDDEWDDDDEDEDEGDDEDEDEGDNWNRHYAQLWAEDTPVDVFWDSLI